MGFAYKIVLPEQIYLKMISEMWPSFPGGIGVAGPFVDQRWVGSSQRNQSALEGVGVGGGGREWGGGGSKIRSQTSLWPGRNVSS